MANNKLTVDLAKAGLSQKDVAGLLRVSIASVSRKVNGQRPWRQAEIDRILAAARKANDELRYEDLFRPAGKRWAA